MRRILLITCWLAVLAGCTSPAPAPTPTKGSKAAGDRYLVYTLSGGIAGRTTTWTIYENGRIRGDSQAYHIAPEETSALFSQIPLSDFIKQSAEPSGQACPDCISATLQYHVGDQSYELSRVLEKTGPDDPVRAWVDKIDALIAKASGK